MIPTRCLAAVAILMLICASSYSAEMRDVNTVPVHRYEITTSSAPEGNWKFVLKATSNENQGPTMWLVGGNGAYKSIGELRRDAQLVWCRNGRCLLILEEPSIENVRLVLYRLGAESERVSGLDEAIRNKIRASIGNGSQVLFYAVRSLKWLDGSHIVLAAQARYVKRGQNAPAYLYTEGYVVNLESGVINQQVSAEDLKTKYGFAEPIAELAGGPPFPK